MAYLLFWRAFLCCLIKGYLRLLLKLKSFTVLRQVWETVSPCTRMKFGHRAFSVARPVLWNSLPAPFHHTDSLHSFKCRLKSHFFSRVLMTDSVMPFRSGLRMKGTKLPSSTSIQSCHFLTKTARDLNFMLIVLMCVDVGELWQTCWWRHARITFVVSGRRQCCLTTVCWTLDSWMPSAPRLHHSCMVHTSITRDSYNDFITSGWFGQLRVFLFTHYYY